MKNKLLICCFLLLTIILFTNCGRNKKNVWITTQNGYLFWGKIVDNNIEYQWEGNTFGNVINGHGVLLSYKNDTLLDKNEIDAYYGSIRSEDIYITSDGDKYIGEMKSKHFNGFGVLIKNNGEIYLGEFKGSKPNGVLSLYKNEKLHYKGRWSKGIFHGKGVLYTDNGEKTNVLYENGKIIKTLTPIITPEGNYQGKILNNQFEDYGLMQYKDGASYEGYWNKGKRQGEGIYIFANGNTAIGLWENGQLQGYGIFDSENTYYEGFWLNSKRNGEGYMQYADSTIYSGFWVNNEKEGYGDILYSNSDAYFGEWKNDKRDGIGKYFYANNDKYEGEWKDDYQNGYGILITPKYTYEGNWEDGWINGFGKITYANGDIYIGDFVENKKHGIGEYQFKNGNFYEGEFVDDTFNGNGIFHFKDGNQYQGEFVNGRIQGEGTLFFIDESGETIQITGVWDGSNNFPKEASILFKNGDLYEGPLKNGFPTEDGVWSTEKERKKSIKDNTPVPQSVQKANEFYKRHKNVWDKAVFWTSSALFAVSFIPGTQEITIPAMHIINGIDTAVSIGSAAIDRDVNSLALEIGGSVVSMVLPKFLKKATSKIVDVGKKPTNNLIKLVIEKAKPIVDKSPKRFMTKPITNKIKGIFQGLNIGYKHEFIPKEKFKIFEKQKKNYKKLKLEMETSSKIVYENMHKVMSKDAKWTESIFVKNNGEQHIVSDNNTNAAASRKILKKFHIDINYPEDSVFLPNSMDNILKGIPHKNYDFDYDDYVFSKLKNVKTKEQTLDILEDIKMELYKGNLALSYKHRFNSVFNEMKNLFKSEITDYAVK